jgi:hypothetical protein
MPNPKKLKEPKVKTPHKMRNLGGGTANEVYKAEYKTGFGGLDRKTAFFKPSPVVKPRKNPPKPGVKIHSAPHIKAVAASRVDQALGFNILAKERFGKRTIDQQERVGTLSPKVKGQATMSNIFDEEMVGLSDDEKQVKLENDASSYQERDGKLYKLTGQRHVAFDYSNPVTQRGLSDLQILDAIISQGDRHGGNIFIDAKGGVHGIDNDMTMDYQQHIKSSNYKMLGMPQFVDAGTAERLLGMDAKDLIKRINKKTPPDQRLQQGELDALEQRFDLVKAYLRQEKNAGRLVRDWSQQTYNAQVGATKKAELGIDILPTGYLGRAMESINAPDTGSEVVSPTGQVIPTQVRQPPVQTPTNLTPPPIVQPPTQITDDLKIPDNLPPLPDIPNVGGPPPTLPSITDIPDEFKIPDTLPPAPQIPDRPPPPTPLTKPNRVGRMRARRATPRVLPQFDEDELKL